MNAVPGAERVHYRACNLCEAICGLEIRTRGDRILSIRGDAADPLSRGHICPKAVALKDLQQDPDRLRGPLIRDGSGFREIDWEPAFDLVAERLAAVYAAHGADAIAVFMGNPSVHNYGNLTHAQRLLGQIRTRNRYSATSADQLPHQLVAYWMYGHQLLLPVPDIDRTRYWLVLGGNPLTSNGSLMTVPDLRGRLKALHARGGRLVVVDPRRTETAEVADEHLFVRPGTDAALLIGLLKIVLEENPLAIGRLAAFSDGVDDVRAALASFEPDALAAFCGVDAAVVHRLAREFVAAGAAVCYGRLGVSAQRHGTLCQWLIQLINLVTGNLDREGGAMFTTPAVDLIEGPASRPGHFGRWRTRVRGLPEFGGELPVAALAEEIETLGEGERLASTARGWSERLATEGRAGVPGYRNSCAKDGESGRIEKRIRALLTVAGNPVLSTPGGARLERALSGLECMLSIDFYLNETTRHAHVILPPTSALEHDHYDLIFHLLAVRNTARYSPPLLAKPAGARHDWEIFEALGQRLAARLGGRHAAFPPPRQIVDLGLQGGPYGALRGHPRALSLAKLEAAPHGIDLGPLQPRLPQRLQHPDKRIRCAVPELMHALRAFADEMARPQAQGLRLIGRRHLRSNNSWMHNSERLVKGPRRDRLWMHPQDLAARGLCDGARVRLRSAGGSVEVEVETSAALLPGVVCLPHGWGHDRDGVRLSVARRHAGVSYNDVSDPQALDTVSGNAAFNGLSVEVEPL
ncbi:MAG: molybdopterin-dependent oxidoreductase [Gammaproteobacteria bacterium]|nr:molybdopterin-dependent oxidoreductase [Gammaproteobacteria bacterium]